MRCLAHQRAKFQPLLEKRFRPVTLELHQCCEFRCEMLLGNLLFSNSKASHILSGKVYAANGVIAYYVLPLLLSLFFFHGLMFQAARTVAAPTRSETPQI